MLRRTKAGPKRICANVEPHATDYNRAAAAKNGVRSVRRKIEQRSRLALRGEPLLSLRVGDLEFFDGACDRRLGAHCGDRAEVVTLLADLGDAPDVLPGLVARLLRHDASAPLPKFVIHRSKLRHELRKQRGTSKYMILVPLIDLKFLNEFAAGGAGTSNRRHQRRAPRGRSLQPM